MKKNNYRHKDTAKKEYVKSFNKKTLFKGIRLL